MKYDDALRQIKAVLDGYKRGASSLKLSAREQGGKVYEAWVLCDVLERLRQLEGYSITMRESEQAALKGAPGPINRSYAHFLLQQEGRPDLEVWTDIEFETLSATIHRAPALSPCFYHELDIVVVDAGLEGRPRHDQIRLGVECKETSVQKVMLRAMLGVRRELSLLDIRSPPTAFQRWPRHDVPADPPSCLLMCSTDPKVTSYAAAGDAFGIDFEHVPLP